MLAGPNKRIRLSTSRDAFFKEALHSVHVASPQRVDKMKNVAYTAGMELMRAGVNDEKTFTSTQSVLLGEDEFSVLEDASDIPYVALISL